MSDITYLKSKKGWLYLVVILDLFSRRVVGWHLSRRIDPALIVKALKNALATRCAPKIFHSDRGVQYAAGAVKELLEEQGSLISMSRKGDCWDNAVAESFFSILRKELTFHTSFLDLEHAKEKLFHYIEVFYNRERIHGTLGYTAPVDFEEQNLLT